MRGLVRAEGEQLGARQEAAAKSPEDLLVNQRRPLAREGVGGREETAKKRGLVQEQMLAHWTRGIVPAIRLGSDVLDKTALAESMTALGTTRI